MGEISDPYEGLDVTEVFIVGNFDDERPMSENAKRALDHHQKMKMEIASLRTSLNELHEECSMGDMITSNRETIAAVKELGIQAIAQICRELAGVHPFYPETYPESLTKLGLHLKSQPSLTPKENQQIDKLETYIGSKIIQAQPMKYGDYCARKDQACNADKADDDGYLVVYPPDNYESWSPKSQFETAYRLVTDGERAMC